MNFCLGGKNCCEKWKMDWISQGFPQGFGGRGNNPQPEWGNKQLKERHFWKERETRTIIWGKNGNEITKHYYKLNTYAITDFWSCLTLFCIEIRNLIPTSFFKYVMIVLLKAIRDTFLPIYDYDLWSGEELGRHEGKGAQFFGGRDKKKQGDRKPC